MSIEDKFERLTKEIDEIQLAPVNGRITEVIGMLIKAVVPQVKIGELCLVKREQEPLRCEVVGFTQHEVLLSPLGEMSGIGPSSEVIPTRLPMHIKVGDALLGRILNGLGEPIDTDTKGPLELSETCPVIQSPPNPLTRKMIDKPMSTGVRAIDGILTCGVGQRVGIFAAAGGGKSTLLGMIAKNVIKNKLKEKKEI